MAAATGLSTKTLFPVPIKRLIVLLPVLAVNTYFPTRVVQQSASWLAPTTDLNAPSRNSPAWLECASVMTAVPSGYTEKPNGVSVPVGADTATGTAPVIAPSWSRTTSTVPGSGSVFNVTSSCVSSIAPTCAVLPLAGAPPPASSSPVVPSSHSTVFRRSANESTVVAPATYRWSFPKSTLTGALVVAINFSNVKASPSRLNTATVLEPLLTAATSSPLYCLTPRALPPTPPFPCVDRLWINA